MYKNLFPAFLLVIFFFSCKNQSQQTKEQNTNKDSKIRKSDSTQTTFTIIGSKKSTVQNGESIEYYKENVIKMRGMMKDGKRDGLWKSWYEDGTPWSETTFKEGKKNGRTATWYENGKKRYEGFYSNETESGKWTFWDEKGNLIQTKEYEKNSF